MNCKTYVWFLLLKSAGVHVCQVYLKVQCIRLMYRNTSTRNRTVSMSLVCHHDIVNQMLVHVMRNLLAYIHFKLTMEYIRVSWWKGRYVLYLVNGALKTQYIICTNCMLVPKWVLNYKEMMLGSQLLVIGHSL